MSKFSKPIVFLGSGPVASQALELLAKEFVIEAVITKPRPKHHRGAVPVLSLTSSLKLPTYTVASRLELDNLLAYQKFKSRLGILIDFGIIVSQKAIDNFPLGIINSHFSVLPEWRGADPITFAVLSGQKTTGVSLMLLVEAMDEGPLLAYGEYELIDDITTPKLTDGLIKLSDALLADTVRRYMAGQVVAVPQTVTGYRVSYSRKLIKADGLIDWQKPAEQLEREVRAYASWPRSYGKLGDVEVVFLKVRVSHQTGRPGSIVANKQKLIVCCGQQALEILRLQPAGKRPMSAQEFLAGYGQRLQ